MKLILGSQSPRRREILSYFSFPFQQATSEFDEDSVPFSGDPLEYVQILSKGKNEKLFLQFPDDIILTADTIVYRAGKIYGKPRDQEEGIKNLTSLAGQWHTVYTGITLRYKEQEWQDMTETQVLLNALNDKQIRTYYDKLPYADKAGGYMIQQAGGIIVQRIEGCYYNVLGLPLNSLHKLLLNLEIDLWDYIQ